MLVHPQLRPHPCWAVTSNRMPLYWETVECRQFSERALTTPHVRRKLGIELEGGQVQTKYPKPEVLKGLTKLVDEIGTGTVKVAQFMTVKDRVTYINRFKDKELPDPRTETDGAAPLVFTR